MLRVYHSFELFINEIIPESVRPVLVNVAITTVDIEFTAKMISLGLSSSYLIWKWYTQAKDRNKK